MMLRSYRTTLLVIPIAPLCLCSSSLTSSSITSSSIRHHFSSGIEAARIPFRAAQQIGGKKSCTAATTDDCAMMVRALGFRTTTMYSSHHNNKPTSRGISLTRSGFPGSGGGSGLLGTPSAALYIQRAHFGKGKEGKDGEVASNPKEELSKPDVSMMDVVKVVATNLWPKGRWDLKTRVVVAFAFVFATKLAKVSVPFWFKSVVDSLVPGTAAQAAVTIGPYSLGIFAMVAAYGITRLVASFTDEMKSVIFTPVASNAANVIGMNIFDKLHQKDLTYHLSKQTGSLSRDMDRGSRAFSLVTFDIFFALGPTAIELALVCYMLQSTAGFNLVCVAASAVGLYFTWTFAITKWRAKFRQEYNETDSKVGGMVIDSLMNYETVKYFGCEKFESKRVLDLYLRMNKAVLNLDASMGLLNFGQQAIFIGAATAGLYFGATSVLAGTMTVGDMVLVDALLLQLYQPLSFLGIVYRELTTSTQNMEKMLGLIKSDIQIRNDVEKPKLEFKAGTIEFKNVSFQYDNSRPILKNVNLTIPGGTTCAFVGPSGSGKTTIFRLMFRFFDPSEGSILIDGQDIKEHQLDTVRKNIGVVPQDTVMFNDTIRNNIAYGNVDSNPTEEEIVEAARCAHLDQSIRSFNDGYDTMVGERGMMLSGGEKQRLAIARVVLKGSPILLADEATSALDTKTEESVMKTLKTAQPDKPNKTIIMIAHRLTTIQSADTIFVLNGKGEVVQQGSHDALLASGEGLYHQLWMRQIKDQTVDM